MTDTFRITPFAHMQPSTLVKALAISLPLLLTACDSGLDTVENPFVDGGESVNQGPPAANQDVRDFEVNVWNSLKLEERCGNCHGNSGQSPTFADATDVNLAYAQAVPLVNMQDPSSSVLVTKVGAGHNCWLASDSACADSIENMITAWAGVSDTTTARVIQLTAPTIKDPGQSKNYPSTATDNGSASFEQTVYQELLAGNCTNCHYEEGSSQQQSPFFANPDDVDSAYEAAKPKINIDTPSQSRFVRKLMDENHNCPNGPSMCFDDAMDMQAAIEAFAGAINPDTIDTNLVYSKALTLLDGIIATGGSRHEANAIATWEFKTGTGSIAYDTSGILPEMHLSLDGNVEWLGAYGLDFTGGRAWANTQSSKKLHDHIKSSGEYSIEAWVIPANVTQEDANIVSYDAGSISKNFSLVQTLYNYNFHNRVDFGLSDQNGVPFLSTEDAGEILQSSLQHVVVTYDPIVGRKIYVNGQLIGVDDPITDSTSISSWDDTFAFVLGNSISNSQTWLGKIRMLQISNRVLTQEQVTQNFEVGVGQKYFLLFSVGELIGEPADEAFIRFEVSQFDEYSYLFEKPTFVSLDPDWAPGGFTIRNMRIGVNGREAITGQSFANMNMAIDTSYNSAEGQTLSERGAVIALEKGSDSDEFFLTFEVLGANTYAYNEPTPDAPVLSTDPVSHIGVTSDIGVRTFEEINATIAAITGIPVTNSAADSVFQQYRQQLPTVETIDAFLSSHQMAIAQLALTYCSEAVEADAALSTGDSNRILFTDFNFGQNAPVAFDSAQEKSDAIDPVLDAVLLSSLDSQPDNVELQDLLGSDTQSTLSWTTTAFGANSANYDSLITEMLSCPAPGDPHYKEDPANPGQPLFPCNYASDINNTARTREIVKAICAATVGSAAMLIQ
ncbi:MAG: LamG domain-containing protein [Gammaproteobacteria bacterium]|nr:LamG domain-containing protein [Gammaproteobacteria bacterium]